MGLGFYFAFACLASRFIPMAFFSGLTSSVPLHFSFCQIGIYVHGPLVSGGCPRECGRRYVHSTRIRDLKLYVFGLILVLCFRVFVFS